MTPGAASMRTPRRIDVVAVALLLTFVMVGTSQAEPEAADRAADWLTFVCGIVATGVLVWWRRWAIVVAGVVALAIGVHLARQYPAGPVLLPGPLAMMALGYVAPRRVAWAGVAGLLVVAATAQTIAGEEVILHVLFFLGWGLAGVLAGQALAARGERAEAERERIARGHEKALADERLRIAQDVHDSVAHAMATINVQSGVAAHLFEQQPERAASALEAIRTASSDALDELGAILGVLRESESTLPLTPLAGLDDVDELVERARHDGLRVALDQTGDTGAVAPSVGAAAYRVVQEALTNTRRHAGSDARVTVTVCVGERGSLRVVVADDGGEKVTSGADSGRSSGGFGLVGMRERVEALGGSLNAGPSQRSGFLVEAAWPDRLDRARS